MSVSRLIVFGLLVWSSSIAVATAQPGPAFADSVEFVANNAAVVMLARVSDVEKEDESGASVAVFAVDETLKGTHKAHWRLKVAQPAKVVRQWKDESRQVLVASYNGDVALAVIDLASEALAEFTADLALLTKPEEVVRCFREAIRRSPGVTRTLSVGLKVPAEVSRRVEKWRVRAEGVIVTVPVDETLELRARKYALSKDDGERLEGARALRYFRSPENVARAKTLLDDAAYSVLRQAESNDGVEVRLFVVRQAAYETLAYWGVHVEKPVMQEEVQIQEHEAIRRPPHN